MLEFTSGEYRAGSNINERDKLLVFVIFEPEFSTTSDYFSIYEQLKFHAQLR